MLNDVALRARGYQGAPQDEDAARAYVTSLIRAGHAPDVWWLQRIAKLRRLLRHAGSGRPPAPGPVTFVEIAAFLASQVPPDLDDASLLLPGPTTPTTMVSCPACGAYTGPYGHACHLYVPPADAASVVVSNNDGA